MGNKHTPGPWKIAHAMSGKMFVTIEHNIGMARRQVCEILPDIDTGDFRANAHLIAAAPELLLAVEEATEAFEIASDGGGIDFYAYAKTMRAAIAKAKGEQ